MSKKDAIRAELNSLYEEGAALAVEFQEKKEKQFQYRYQSWYTKALKAVQSLAQDRYAEFKAYYEVDPKRKTLGYGTYVIQDYLKGVAPNAYRYSEFDTREQVLTCFFNQLTILRSMEGRISSLLANIEGELYSELQDSELEVAETLTKVSPRAAGALAGVVIEGHLQKVASAREVKISKKHPTISELSDPLKAAGVLDTPTWRKIGFLADLRNLCSHKKDLEPTREQVEELVQGAAWLVKNVF
jgi:hypothetical protein